MEGTGFLIDWAVAVCVRGDVVDFFHPSVVCEGKNV
jgi:hypothetical protein